MVYIFPEPQKEKSHTNLSGHVQHVVGQRKQAGWMSPFKSQPLVFISSAREEVLEIDWLHLTTFSPEALAVIAGFGQTERSAHVRFQVPVVIFIHLIFSIVKSKQMWQRQGSRFSLKVGAKNLSLMTNTFRSAVYQKLIEFDTDSLLQSCFERIVLSVRHCFRQKTTICPSARLDVLVSLRRAKQSG